MEGIDIIIMILDFSVIRLRWGIDLLALRKGPAGDGYTPQSQ